MTAKRGARAAVPTSGMVVVATAGHVDHGKSTLLRALTGADPDRWEAEKRRGLTIDLGFVHAELTGETDETGAAGKAGKAGHAEDVQEPVTIAFVDVPGHRRFVSNMLAGVGPVPAVLFVVAADDGWMPQSQEHLDALAALGVSQGILAITRSDLMEPGLALAEAREAMAGTPLADIPAVAVSAVTGEGMGELREVLVGLARGLPVPAHDADVRLWVDRSFTIGGAGTVVTGTLGAGTIQVGDVLEAGIGGSRSTVRGMQSLGAEVSAACGPARVALNLRAVKTADVSRGTSLLTPGRWRGTSVLDVRIMLVGGTGGVGGPLPENMMAHIGSAAVGVRVRPLRGGGSLPGARPDGGPEGSAAGTSPPGISAPASSAPESSAPDEPIRWARLTLDVPLTLRVGDRLILREPGTHRIPAGATVVDPAPPGLTRRGAARRRVAVLDAIEYDSTAAAADAATADADPTAAGVPSLRSELERRGWAHVDDLRAWGTPGVPASTDRAGWLIDEARADELASGLTEFVAAEDERDPLEPGVTAEAARGHLGLPDAALLAAVLARPAAADLVERGGRILRQGSSGPDGGSALPASVLRAAETLGERLAAAPFVAPTAGELAALGLGRRELAACGRAGRLTEIGPGIWLGPDALDAAVAVLRGLPQPFTPSEARTALGSTRRVVMPLLELLGRQRRTRRCGDDGHAVV